MWPEVGAWMALGVTLWIVAGSSDIILFDVTLWIVAGSGARMTPMLRSRLTLHNNVQLATGAPHHQNLPVPCLTLEIK